MLGRLTISLGLLFLAACSEQLHHDLDERVANEIVAVLASEGVVATKVRSGESWSVEVTRSQVARGLAVLSERGLPRRQTSYDELLEASGGLVPSSDEERRRSTALVETGLERTLLSLDGVYDARVHAVIPKPNGGGLSRQEPAPPRVSVVVLERAERPAPPNDALVAIIMGAVERVTPDTIAIVRSTVELPGAGEPSMVRVGPFVVAAESERPLQFTLLGLAALGAFLALGLAYSATRRRA